MKVWELIKELNKYPAESIVVTTGGDEERYEDVVRVSSFKTQPEGREVIVIDHYAD